MKHFKLLAALLVCTVMALPVSVIAGGTSTGTNTALKHNELLHNNFTQLAYHGRHKGQRHRSYHRRHYRHRYHRHFHRYHHRRAYKRYPYHYRHYRYRGGGFHWRRYHRYRHFGPYLFAHPGTHPHFRMYGYPYHYGHYRGYRPYGVYPYYGTMVIKYRDKKPYYVCLAKYRGTWYKGRIRSNGKCVARIDGRRYSTRHYKIFGPH